MNAGTIAGAAIAFTACSAAASALVRLAPSLGLVDDASDAPDRKHHAHPVPLVGGTAIALSIGAVCALQGTGVVGGAVVHGFAFEALAVLWALALAFACGLVDDVAPRGLPPLAKLLGQIAAGCALARGLTVDGAAPSVALQCACVFVAVLAQNAANTFDNADGVLTGVASAGLVCASPFAGATLALLPWSLPFRRPTARAWLGDSGSHLLGILLLSTPIAWAALVLPVLDLGRVVVVRLRAGDPIWRGDRRHWAHRLQARGNPPAQVVFWLVLGALPAIVWAAISSARAS